jgi:hypothetical protein
MYHLPIELILYILEFDDNWYYLKQFNKCIAQLNQYNYKSNIIHYLNPLHFYYEVYYNRYIISKTNGFNKEFVTTTQYILEMNRKCKNYKIFINNEKNITKYIKPSLIYKVLQSV